MGKIESTLRGEITRLARKEIKSSVTPMEARLRELDARVRRLQAENAQMGKQIARLLANKPAPAIIADNSGQSTSRMSPAMLKRFRKGNNLTQSHLAKLMGVSMGAITGWEKGSNSARANSRETFAELRKLSRKQLAEKLKTIGIKPGRRRRSK